RSVGSPDRRRARQRRDRKVDRQHAVPAAARPAGYDLEHRKSQLDPRYSSFRPLPVRNSGASTGVGKRFSYHLCADQPEPNVSRGGTALASGSASRDAGGAGTYGDAANATEAVPARGRRREIFRPTGSEIQRNHRRAKAGQRVEGQAARAIATQLDP